MQESLRQVARVPSQVRLCELRVDVERLLAVEEGLFVLSLLYERHSPVRVQALALVKVYRLGVERNGLIKFASLKGVVSLILPQLSKFKGVLGLLFFLFLHMCVVRRLGSGFHHFV